MEKQATITKADWEEAADASNVGALFFKAIAMGICMMPVARYMNMPAELLPLCLVLAFGSTWALYAYKAAKIAQERAEGDAWEAVAEAEKQRQKAIAIAKKAIEKANASSASADASRKEAVAAIQEADAMRSQIDDNASAMERLSYEVRALQASLKGQSERIKEYEQATAAAERETAAARQELTIADNRIRRYEKAEAERKATAERDALAKSIKATWSACGKDETKMEERFAGQDWRKVVGV